jgi:hypothetical protein
LGVMVLLNRVCGNPHGRNLCEVDLGGKRTRGSRLRRQPRALLWSPVGTGEKGGCPGGRAGAANG